MTRKVLFAALLASSPVLADLASQPADAYEQPSLVGIYAAIGGGGGFLFVPGDNALAYDLEIRVGYSFNTMLQAYVAGALDGGKLSGNTFRTEQITAFAQYHLYVQRALMVYGRGGIGVGLSGDLVPGSTAVGLAGAAGLGVEFRVAPNLFAGPELYYRYTALSTQGTDSHAQTVGLQINLIYY